MDNPSALAPSSLRPTAPQFRNGNQHDIPNQQQRRRRFQHRRGRGSVPQNANSRELNAFEESNADTTSQSNRGISHPHRGRAGRGQGGHGRSRVQTHAPRSNGVVVAPTAPAQSESRTRVVGTRQFASRLTTEENSNTLDVRTPVTKQGHSQARTHHQNEERGARRSTNHVRKPKSVANDIATRTSEDIDNGQYECPICTNEIRRNSRIWSCDSCWTVFHLSCVKRWASNQASKQAQDQQQNRDSVGNAARWRCPGCNLPKETLPQSYTCWCQKEHDPRNVTGLPPHSCGNTCGKERFYPKKCPHPCQLMCHPGPCPPCAHMGPTQSCYCGKESATRRCIDTNYDTGWTCGQKCEDIMPCSEHECQRQCHEGLCGSCEVRVDARCYCGKSRSLIMCSETGQRKQSKKMERKENGEMVKDSWTGSFECKELCNRAFSCGKHYCQKVCHVQQDDPTPCPRLPQLVLYCPCGKTKLTEISEKTREFCTDPIPNCKKPCLKPLRCGHKCQKVCHQGECLPCLERISISCRCGRSTSTSICHQGDEVVPQCAKICRTTLNCGRHACDEHCCTGERKAQERQSIKKKPRALDSVSAVPLEVFEAEHICTRVCGRPLKCGTHFCQELCHKGPCNSCREALFDDISCHCGRTILTPPLPCGTKPPSCRFPCERSKPCGHPQVLHNCHLGDEDCPKCPYLITKQCLCGKKVLKNQQCWLKDVRCGEICGKKLRCGSHSCRKTCHAPGNCEDSDGSVGCQQPCGKPRKRCGHPDDDICHAPFPCKEIKPCNHKLMITCACQNLKQEMKCNASASSEGNMKKSIPCDQECARLERNRKLASAFEIDPETHTDDHVPYSSATLSFYRENAQWAQAREREYRIFAADENERRLRFKPMQKRQRGFLHSLAEDFGLDSESMDPEPHRHITIFKTPKFVMAPMKTLAQCVQIKLAQRLTAVGTQNQQKIDLKTSGLQPYNAFLILNPRFALTVEELQSAIQPVFSSDTALMSQISFLPSEDVVMKVSYSDKEKGNAQDLETRLLEMKPLLAKVVSAQSIGTLQLCHVDESLNVLRRENNSSAQNGWSQVAARAATPVTLQKQAPIGYGGSFAVLSGKVSLSTRKSASAAKRVKESVVDNWEEAAVLEEKKELAAAGEEPTNGLNGSGEVVD